jgi:type 1 glutamine amidotransferase
LSAAHCAPSLVPGHDRKKHHENDLGELVTTVLVACEALHSASAFAQEKHLLVLGEERGYRHEPVSHAMAVIERLGAQSGLWDTTIRTDTEVLTKQKLEFNAKTLNDFDAVLFYTDGDLEMTAQQRRDLLPFVHVDGKGFVGTHSASITWAKWPEFVEMLGGTFDEHPWGTFEAPILVEDAQFSGMSSWPTAFTYRNEIYQMKNFSRCDIRVLMQRKVRRHAGNKLLRGARWAQGMQIYGRAG